MNSDLKLEQIRGPVLIGLLATVCIAVALQPPVPQDLRYHVFADTTMIGGIANGLNVLSNFPFFMIGAIGLEMAIRSGRSREPGGRWKRVAMILMFAGVLLIALGSGWYHLEPANRTLLWDRLPMTVVFMMFFALMIGDRIGSSIGRRLYLPLLLVGIVSVLYWYLGERSGTGDLRPYVVVQFAPMLLLPLIALLYPAGEFDTRDFWIILLLYGAAKVVEIGDSRIFEATAHVVSGHTLKHLLAAAATGWMLRLIPKQRDNREIKEQ